MHILVKKGGKVMEITYTKVGDYYLPNISLGEDYRKVELGKYGKMRLNYLKNNCRVEYMILIMKNKLMQHLVEVDNSARERVENIVKSMAEKERVDEELKAKDQMKWVGLMNNFRSSAEEIVMEEIICR